MSAIPERFSDLFEKRALAHLATLMPDGSPQVSPVWVERDGDLVIVNSAVGRVKDRNVRRDPRVAISMVDPDNPYRRLLIRGRVVEVTTEGADEGIDRLARKYMGVKRYGGRTPGEVRVIYKISPDKVTPQG